MRADEVVTAVTTGYADWLGARRSEPIREPRSHVWASGRRKCVRAMALDLLHPDEGWEDVSVDRLARMHGGEHAERAIVSDLLQVGPRCRPPFEVVEGQQRIEIRDGKGRLLITGKIDGALRFAGSPARIPFEVKSGVTFQRADTIEDLERSPWTRHAPDQMLAYLLAKSEPVGLLVIPKPGPPTFIPVVLDEHRQRAEGFKADAAVAIDARFGLAPMPPFTSDTGECRRCPHFGKSCAPPLDFGPGVRLLADPDLEAALQTRESARDAHLEYERADKLVKARLRGVPEAIVGPYHVNGRWQSRKVCELPPEIKRQYETVNDQGAWLLDVERVPLSD